MDNIKVNLQKQLQHIKFKYHILRDNIKVLPLQDVWCNSTSAYILVFLSNGGIFKKYDCFICNGLNQTLDSQDLVYVVDNTGSIISLKRLEYNKSWIVTTSSLYKFKLSQ